MNEVLSLMSSHVLLGTTTVATSDVQGIIDFGVTIVHFMQAIAAVIAAVFFGWGALEKMMARGNTRKSEAAVETMTNAAIGFGLIFLTFIFVNVLAGAFGAGKLNG